MKTRSHICHSLRSTVIHTDSLRGFRAAMAATLVLFLSMAVQPRVARAQGCGGHGGGHTASPDQTASRPSLSPIWINILDGQARLRQSVAVMSRTDAQFYAEAIRDDVASLADHARDTYPRLRDPLDAAKDRFKRLTKQIAGRVKAGDSTAAVTLLAGLDNEVERLASLFPPDVLPAAAVASEGGGVQKADGVRIAPSNTDSSVAKARYVCPMHPEVTSSAPGNCPTCGMALKKAAG